MARETRPKDYPKLKNYTPTRFMLPTSHYDKKKADRAVTLLRTFAIPRVNGLVQDSGCYRGRSS